MSTFSYYITTENKKKNQPQKKKHIQKHFIIVINLYINQSIKL